MKGAPSHTATVVEIGLLALLYFITARLGQLLAIPPGNITPVWIPSGIILAAVLARGYRVWPGIFLGAFAGNIWAYFSLDSVGAGLRCLLAGTANGIGDSLSAVVGAYLITRTTRGRGGLERAGDAAKFIAFGAVLGSGVSAILGVTALSLAGFISWPKYLSSLTTWWFGDAVGVLVVTPLLLAWRVGWRGLGFGVEKMLFAAALPASTVLALMLLPAVPGLIILPVLLWGAFRFDHRVVFTANALEALWIVGLTAAGIGPFAAGQERSGLVTVPLFIALTTIPVVMMAGALAESVQLRKRLREWERAPHPGPEPVAGEGTFEDWSWRGRRMVGGLLLVGLAATGLAAYFTRPVAEQKGRREFEFDCRAVQERIMGRLAACEQVLRSGAAFAGHAQGISRREWRRFFEQQQIEQKLPGVQGLGFARWIPPQQLAEHLRAVRAEGLPDYAVRPAGDRDVYTSIVYLEPFAGRNLRAFGYDMWSEPVRRAAMERARDLHAAALSGPVRLVQETEQAAQAGTLMYVPVYGAGQPVLTVDQRRAALQGWVYSPYRMTDLMRGILGGWDLLTERRLRLEVLDGEALLYDSQAGETPQAADQPLTWQSRLDVAGRSWTLRFTKTGGRTAHASLVKVWLVLFGGMSLSLLLVGLLANLLASRYQARQRANRLKLALRENETRLTAVLQATDNGILLVSPTGQILTTNRRLTELWRIPEGLLQSGDATSLLRHAREQLAEPEEIWLESTRLDASHEEKAELLRFKDGRVFERHTNVVEQDGRRLGRLWSFRDVTTQQQAKAELGRMRNLLGEGQRIAHLGSWEYIAETQETRWSEEQLRIYGLNPAGPSPHYPAMLRHHIHPEDAARLDETFRQCLHNRAVFELEHRLVRPDGSVRVVQEIARPYFDDHGRLVKYVGATLDITERKQAEKQLREKEASYRTLADSGMALIWTSGLDKKCDYFNQPWLKFTGRTLDQELGDGWAEGVHPDDLARCFRIYTEAFDRRASFSMDYRLRRHDGEFRWVQDEGTPRHDSRGHFLGYIGHCLDITDRKRAEEALQHANANLEQQVSERTASLRASEERLHLAFRATQDGVWDWNLETDEVFYSPRWKRMLGYEEGEIEPHASAWKRLMHPDDLPQSLEVVAGVRRGEREYVMEFRLRHQDGHYVDILSRGFPIRREPEGPIVRIVGTHFDLTERKREAEALRQAKEAAESANRAKSRFLGNMSHEIRTPLNAILGFAQLLRRDPALAPRQQRQLQIINRSGEHLLRLINDVLDMSKIEAGRLQPVWANADFHSLLQDMEAMFRLRARENGIGFEVRHASSVPAHLYTDADKVRQVLLNLLSNAVKFTAQGHIRMQVECAPVPTSTEPHWVRLSLEVTDTGAGIGPEDLERVFEAFEQSESGQRRGDGTGLGLTISRQLARLLGGDLIVSSQVGVGSTFRFTFVAKKIAPASAPPPAPAPPRRLLSLKPGRPQPIVLVVDDIESNRTLLRDLFEKAGFLVWEAPDGATAVARCARESPSVVLMDWQMPGLDGLDATRAIRAGPSGQTTRILMVSATVFDVREEAWKGAGADAFIGKPFQLEDLLGRVGVLLGLEDSSVQPPIEARPGPAEDELRQLPADLRAQLIEATEAGAKARLQELIARDVAPQNPAWARTLGRLAERYDYEALLRTLKEPKLL